MTRNYKWFWQDGATAHILVREVKWTARSCDLSPLDFSPWGFLKSIVYANNPATIQDLEHIQTKTESIN